MRLFRYPEPRTAIPVRPVPQGTVVPVRVAGLWPARLLFEIVNMMLSELRFGLAQGIFGSPWQACTAVHREITAKIHHVPGLSLYMTVS